MKLVYLTKFQTISVGCLKTVLFGIETEKSICNEE